MRESIQSVLDQTIKPDRFIVIDNSSTDDSYLIAEELEVELAWADNKHQYITGLNTALSHCSDKLFFMQNDVVLHPQCLEFMIRETVNNRDFVAQPIVYDFRGKVDNVGMNLIWPAYGINRKKVSGKDCGYATSVVFMIDKEAIRKNGYYDPQFAPAYMEDLDYSLRCRENRTKQIVVPEASVKHLGNHTFSSTYRKIEISRILRRNRIKFINKNYRGIDKITRLTVTACLDVTKEAIDVIAEWWISRNNRK